MQREEDRLVTEGRHWRLLPRNTLLLCKTDPDDPTRIVEINLKVPYTYTYTK